MKRVHFLGIGGSGASAAAALAEGQGFEVSGCDLEPNNEFTTKFKKSQLLKGHDLAHLQGVVNRHPGKIDILAVTPAIFSLDPQNPELVAAKQKDIPIMTWQQFVGEYLTKRKFVIAVCGTHGKTTTTAMIAQMLEDANLDPTVLLGAIHPKWKANYRISGKRHLELVSGFHRIPKQVRNDENHEYFVIEADEFNDNFLYFKPDITIVTNIEMDHPEYFKDFESYKESFKKFLLQTRGIVVANLSDPSIAEVLKLVMKTPSRQTYHGRDINVQYLDYSKNKLNFSLRIPGEFNKLNAQAAMQVGLLLGINPGTIKKSLSSYTGVGRRFEYIGDYHGAKVYSDFGHHPTEIRETLKAVKEKFPTSRILVIYQPHMFTRTKYLFNDFVKEFKEAPVDKIFVMDIYQSREHDLGEVTSQQLAQAVSKDSVSYIGPTDQVLEKLKPEIKTGDILFFMSAGDTDYLAKKLVSS